MFGYRNSYLLRHPGEFFACLWSEITHLRGCVTRGYGWKHVANADEHIARYAPVRRALPVAVGTRTTRSSSKCQA